MDWKDLQVGEITKRITAKVSLRSIVLFHNAGKQANRASSSILSARDIKSCRCRSFCCQGSMTSTIQGG